MPTYDYQCDACDHSFEKFQSITARTIRLCPECGKRKVRRLIGAGAGIIFKGSGFYQTDYRSAAYRQAASKDSPSSEGSSDKGSSPDAKAGKPADKSAGTSSKPSKNPGKSDSSQ